MSKKLIDAEETIRNIIIAAPREPDEAIRATASAIVVIQNMPSAQPTQTNADSTQCNTLDCVDRQAAIDTFLVKLTERERKSLRHMWTTVEVKHYIAKILEQLPPAQPTFTEAEIQRMQELDSAQIQKAYEVGYEEGKAQPHWIPCSERLPEIKDNHVSDTVICYCSNGAYAFSQLQENIFGQCSFECERDDDYYEAVGDVIAWMPLPKPYGGDAK